jgi:hypothetical protein
MGDIWPQCGHRTLTLCEREKQEDLGATANKGDRLSVHQVAILGMMVETSITPMRDN